MFGHNEDSFGDSTDFFSVTIYSITFMVVFFTKKKKNRVNITKRFININQLSQTIVFK